MSAHLGLHGVKAASLEVVRSGGSSWIKLHLSGRGDGDEVTIYGDNYEATDANATALLADLQRWFAARASSGEEPQP